MGTVVSLRPRARHDFTQHLGMIVALGSWSMMFGSLFFLYFAMRARATTWPPAGAPHLPVALPSLATAVLFASSLALVRGISELAQGRRRALTLWVAVAMALGTGFVALQIQTWKGVWASGLTPAQGTYGSLFYGLTMLHALHVAAGLLVLLVIFVRSLYGTYNEHNVVRVQVAAMFWHFVDVVWLLMFVSLYLS